MRVDHDPARSARCLGFAACARLSPYRRDDIYQDSRSRYSRILSLELLGIKVLLVCVGSPSIKVHERPRMVIYPSFLCSRQVATPQPHEILPSNTSSSKSKTHVRKRSPGCTSAQQSDQYDCACLVKKSPGLFQRRRMGSFDEVDLPHDRIPSWDFQDDEVFAKF